MLAARLIARVERASRFPTAAAFANYIRTVTENWAPRVRQAPTTSAR
ncbi:hypothetical protein ACWGJX_45430 [Streptomyces sp. NPDC054775]